MTSLLARRAFVVTAGASVVGATAYFSAAIYSSQPHVDDSTNTVQNSASSHSVSSSSCNDCCSKRITSITDPNRNLTYQKNAEIYDEYISREETLIGLPLFRRALLYFNADGKVLEVAGGTGRNLNFYPSNVKSVVVTDISDNMLMKGRIKVNKFKDEKDRKRFKFFVADAVKMTQFYDEDTFDTVVDTFGLCSFDDPVAVLKELQRVCKPDGRILLLEHGRSKTWNWITNILDKTAERHAEKWGCVYNRDLDQILKDSDLEIETLRTWHFATTYYVICKPSKKLKSTFDQDVKIENID